MILLKITCSIMLPKERNAFEKAVSLKLNLWKELLRNILRKIIWRRIISYKLFLPQYPVCEDE